MTRVVIPIHNGKLSEFFSQCYQYEIYNIEGGVVVGNEVVSAPFKNISDISDWASKQNITDIITHKIDKKVIDNFSEKKITLFIGIERSISSNIIEDYLLGKLQSNEEIITELNK